MKEYIVEKQRKFNLSKKLFDDIRISVRDPLPDDIDLDEVLFKIESMLRPESFSNVEAIFIGEFPELTSREMNAAYTDGVIYITNRQDSEEDMIDDLVHEIAHAVEEKYSKFIYGDKKIIEEFLRKRKYIYSYLEYEGYDIPDEFLVNPNYSPKIDKFLYRDIGYPTLESLTSDIFPSPYSITSVREYWAISYEMYVFGQEDMIKTMSPNIYNKLKEIF